MKKLLMSCVLLGLVFASACATKALAPADESFNSIVGPWASMGPSPDNFQQIIKDYLGHTLLDPNSAEYTNWRGPSPGWEKPRFGAAIYGYRACVEVNAKNRMGGYAGRKTWYFMIKNGQILKAQGGYDNSDVFGQVMQEQVARACNF